MRKGLFIAIYGVNNIGKSTHARLLVKKIRAAGRECEYLKYPIYDLEPTGPEINRILRSGGSQKVSEEHLQTLFMQNRRDFEPKLRQMLDDGKVVVAEDYVGTAIAWGTAKGLTLPYMEKLNGGLLKEDLSLLIHGKRDVRARENGHIHENNDELMEKVANNLDELGKKYGWKKIPLQDRIEDTAELVWEAVRHELAL